MVFAGKIKLPNKKDMKEFIYKERDSDLMAQRMTYPNGGNIPLF
jgi:hypothetical protein